jgi:hypothetical protein
MLMNNITYKILIIEEEVSEIQNRENLKTEMISSIEIYRYAAEYYILSRLVFVIG